MTGHHRQAVVADQLGCDGFAQAHLATIVRIPRPAGAQRVSHSVDDVRGSREVRLAAHQRHDRLAICLQLTDFGEDGVDGRRRQSRGPPREPY